MTDRHPLKAGRRRKNLVVSYPNGSGENQGLWPRDEARVRLLILEIPIADCMIANRKSNPANDLQFSIVQSAIEFAIYRQQRKSYPEDQPGFRSGFYLSGIAGQRVPKDGIFETTAIPSLVSGV